MNEGRAIQPHQPSLPGDGDRKIEIHWARALQRQRANKPTSNNAQLLPRFMICACPDSSFYPSSENGGLRKDPRRSFTNFRILSSSKHLQILRTVLWLSVPRVLKSQSARPAIPMSARSSATSQRPVN
ncbi:hypothetical protein BDQ94DRAFT_62009 [Aspergillus welwitschiae]|uniref:Uncharacterized protein n=1 Tax=Aspergillus welwitschiae TaxID=1341132 RepID=A0A3F3PWI8_9EURO|nr:hypothetical protein BDQ94DRAFT_62009 [Aspergillus welwitschiae]RDH31122.1 hypothetical protein BDQ94DRAFT_62009 [Aspergillus welwitschiae]